MLEISQVLCSAREVEGSEESRGTVLMGFRIPQGLIFTAYHIRISAYIFDFCRHSSIKLPIIEAAGKGSSRRTANLLTQHSAFLTRSGKHCETVDVSQLRAHLSQLVV